MAARRSTRKKHKLVRVHYRMPTGGAVYNIPGSKMQILWAGPGAGLQIGTPMKAGGFVTKILHPKADGNYSNRNDAEDAIEAFLSAHA